MLFLSPIVFRELIRSPRLVLPRKEQLLFKRILQDILRCYENRIFEFILDIRYYDDVKLLGLVFN